MERQVIFSLRFEKNIDRLYEYLLEEFSSKAAYRFLKKLYDKIDIIARYPDIGSPSLKMRNVRSVILRPYNKIYYRLEGGTIELPCINDMRRDNSHSLY